MGRPDAAKHPSAGESARLRSLHSANVQKITPGSWACKLTSNFPALRLAFNAIGFPIPRRCPPSIAARQNRAKPHWSIRIAPALFWSRLPLIGPSVRSPSVIESARGMVCVENTRFEAAKAQGDPAPRFPYAKWRWPSIKRCPDQSSAPSIMNPTRLFDFKPENP